jgi:hypothetical protein
MCFRSWELEQAEVVWLGYRRAEGVLAAAENSTDVAAENTTLADGP